MHSSKLIYTGGKKSEYSGQTLISKNLTKLGALEEFIKAAASAAYSSPAIIWLREHSLLNMHHALILGSVLMQKRLMGKKAWYLKRRKKDVRVADKSGGLETTMPIIDILQIMGSIRTSYIFTAGIEKVLMFRKKSVISPSLQSFKTININCFEKNPVFILLLS